jgi:hypothetical protein
MDLVMILKKEWPIDEKELKLCLKADKSRQKNKKLLKVDAGLERF